MIIRVLMFSLLFSSIASAQEGKGGFFLGLEKMDENQYEDMKKELMLNNNQLDSIKKFDQDAINRRAAIEKIEKDSLLFFDKIKEVSLSRKEKIETVLTPEQYKKYLSYQFTLFMDQNKKYILRRYSHLNIVFDF